MKNDELTKIIKDIAKSVGFELPKECIVLAELPPDVIGGYVYPMKKIVISADKEWGQDDIFLRFAVAHEFGHMLHHFVVEQNIDAQLLTQESYEKSVQKFFKNPNIRISEEQYNLFKDFISQSLLADKDILRIINFDMNHTMPVTMMDNKEALEVYRGSSTEFFADEFATKHIIEMYRPTELSIDELNTLQAILHGKSSLQVKDTHKTQEQYMTQINQRAKKIVEHVYGSIESAPPGMFEKQVKNMTTNLTPYTSYDFDKFSKIMREAINDTVSLILNIRQLRSRLNPEIIQANLSNQIKASINNKLITDFLKEQYETPKMQNGKTITEEDIKKIIKKFEPVIINMMQETTVTYDEIQNNNKVGVENEHISILRKFVEEQRKAQGLNKNNTTELILVSQEGESKPINITIEGFVSDESIDNTIKRVGETPAENGNDTAPTQGKTANDFSKTEIQEI